ncbi:hypothetical protein Emed_000355 [Eimeria media]
MCKQLPVAAVQQQQQHLLLLLLLRKHSVAKAEATGDTHKRRQFCSFPLFTSGSKHYCCLPLYQYLARQNVGEPLPRAPAIAAAATATATEAAAAAAAAGTMATLRSLWIIASSTCSNCVGGPYEGAPFGGPDDLLHRAPLPLPTCRGAPSRVLQRSNKGAAAAAAAAGRSTHDGASPAPQHQQPAAAPAPAPATPLTTQTPFADASGTKSSKPSAATAAAAAAEHPHQSSFQAAKSLLPRRAETRPAAAAAAARGGGWTPAAAAAGGAPVGPHPVVYGEGCTARLLFSRVFPSAEARWQRLARRLYTPLPTDGELLGCFFSQVLLPPQDDVTPAAAAAAAGPGSAAAAAAAADWRTEQQQQQQQPLFFFDALQEAYYKELTWPCGPLLLLAVPRRGLAAAVANQQQQQHQQQRFAPASAGAGLAAAGGLGRSEDTASVQWQHGVGPLGMSNRAAAVAAAAAAATASTGFLWPIAFTTAAFGFLDDLLDLFIATLSPVPIPDTAAAAAAAAGGVGDANSLKIGGRSGSSGVAATAAEAAAAAAAASEAARQGRRLTPGSAAAAGGAPGTARRKAAGGFALLLQLAAPFGRPQVTELRQLLLLLRQLQSAPPKTLPDLAAPKGSAASSAATAAGTQGQQEKEQEQQQQQQQQDQQRQQRATELLLPPKPTFEGPPQPLAALRRLALAARGLLAELPDRAKAEEFPDIRCLLSRCPYTAAAATAAAATGAAAAPAAAAAGAAAAAPAATETAPSELGESCIRSLQVMQWRRQLQQQQQEWQQEQQRQQQEGQGSRDTESGAFTRSPLSFQQGEGKGGLWGPSTPQEGRPPAASGERIDAAATVSGFVPAAAASRRIISNNSSSSSSGSNVLRTETEKRPLSPERPPSQGGSSSSNSSGKMTIEVYIKETFCCQLKGHEGAETPQQETSVGGELWLYAPLSFPAEVSLPVSFQGSSRLPSLSVHQAARLHTKCFLASVAVIAAAGAPFAACLKTTSSHSQTAGWIADAAAAAAAVAAAAVAAAWRSVSAAAERGPLPRCPGAPPRLASSYFFDQVREPPVAAARHAGGSAVSRQTAEAQSLQMTSKLHRSAAAAAAAAAAPPAAEAASVGSQKTSSSCSSNSSANRNTWGRCRGLAEQQSKAASAAAAAAATVTAIIAAAAAGLSLLLASLMLGTFRVVNAGEAVLWTIPPSLEGAPDSKIGDAPAHSLSLLGELRVGPSSHQVSLQQQQQQQQQQQRPWAAAGSATHTRSSNNTGSSSSSSFLTERERIVLDIGRSNFAAVVLLEGRGLSVAGAHVNPAAVDVFALNQEGAAAAAAAAAGAAAAPAAAAAAATASGGFTVKVNTSISSGRCLIWNVLGDYRPARAALKWQDSRFEAQSPRSPCKPDSTSGLQQQQQQQEPQRQQQQQQLLLLVNRCYLPLVSPPLSSFLSERRAAAVGSSRGGRTSCLYTWTVGLGQSRS